MPLCVRAPRLVFCARAARCRCAGRRVPPLTPTPNPPRDNTPQTPRTRTQGADLIALVYRGSVLEQGTHEALMAIPWGGYAKLVAAQLKNAGGR